MYALINPKRLTGDTHIEHMCASVCWVCALVPKVEPGTQYMVHVQAYAQTVLWRPHQTWHTHVWVCKHVLSVCWYQAQNRAHSTCVIVLACAESVLWCLMQNPAHGALESGTKLSRKSCTSARLVNWSEFQWGGGWNTAGPLLITIYLEPP